MLWCLFGALEFWCFGGGAGGYIQYITVHFEAIFSG